MSSMIQDRIDQITENGTRTFQIVTLKRYDNDEGSWGVHVLLWPGNESMDQYVVHRTVGLFGRDHFADFFARLPVNGFVSREFVDLSNAKKNYIINQILPMEWKSLMDDPEMASRVHLWRHQDQIDRVLEEVEDARIRRSTIQGRIQQDLESGMTNSEVARKHHISEESIRNIAALNRYT